MMFCSPAGAGTLGAALAAVAATRASAPTKPMVAIRIFAASSSWKRLDVNNRRADRIPRRANPAGCTAGEGKKKPSPLVGEGWVGVGTLLLGVHRVEELGVALRFLELVDQEFEPVIGAHRHQDAPQHPHLRQDAPIDQ